MNIALYTIITGGYDTLQPISQPFPCYVFTDDENLNVKGWETVRIEKEDNPHTQQRRYKILIPEYLNQYDTVIYMDANTSTIRSIDSFLRIYKGGFLTKKHPSRDCVYKEGFRIIELHKAAPEIVKAQMADYLQRGIEPAKGLFETGIVIRDKSTKEFCQAWYTEQIKYSHRDQLSIIAAQKETGYKIDTFLPSVFNTYFKVTKHKPQEQIKIHYLTPYAIDKNIGRAYNEAIELIPNENDWIVIRDGDTAFTTPDWGKQIYDCLRNANDYSLLGAVTNRIGGNHQRVAGMMEEMDLRKHYEKGLELSKSNYGKIAPTSNGVAGFLMAFQKKTWNKVKFRENSIKFDTEFSNDVRKINGKIGLMTGLYILHLYRIWSDNPQNECEHLK